MPQDLRARVLDVLKTIYDPEIPVNIYELGLIYDLQVDGDGAALVKMTLTAPNCPVAESLPVLVKQKVSSVEGITAAKVELVFDPPWDREKMSDAAKLTLGFDLGPSIVPLTRLQR